LQERRHARPFWDGVPSACAQVAPNWEDSRRIAHVCKLRTLRSAAHCSQYHPHLLSEFNDLSQQDTRSPEDLYADPARFLDSFKVIAPATTWLLLIVQSIAFCGFRADGRNSVLNPGQRLTTFAGGAKIGIMYGSGNPTADIIDRQRLGIG
jgi:hypothetical protein